MNNHFNYDDIVADMIEALREMDDGASITTFWLLKGIGYDESEIGQFDLMELHFKMVEAAEANNIVLDMSAHDNKFEGLPYALDFVVHNSKAQYKCPYCGSTNTARILYGMPAMDDEMQRKLREGKIVLGGCMINTAEIDGKRVVIDPDRKCNDCNKEFSTDPIKQDLLVSNIR